MDMLRAVKRLNLPQGMVAAGFVRNLVWDRLHGTTTPLNDVDVIFYTPEQSAATRERDAQQLLQQQFPDLAWDVKNQARMHLKHADRPYQSCSDAMTFWPEKETAVAAYLDRNERVALVAPFGLDSLMAGLITANPARDIAVFAHRINSKCWLQRWPQLQVRHR